jgi:hypothetical protein
VPSAYSSCNLGILYRETGRRADAEKAYIEALDIRFTGKGWDSKIGLALGVGGCLVDLIPLSLADWMGLDLCPKGEHLYYW